jgi:hypothetical protein
VRDDKFFLISSKNRHFIFAIFEAESIRRKINCCIRLKYKIVLLGIFSFKLLEQKTETLNLTQKKNGGYKNVE